MIRLIGTGIFCGTVLALFVLAFMAGGTPHNMPLLIGHGPTPIPDPWEDVVVAHGPTPIPDPWEDVVVAHGPTPIPDPWEDVVVAHGPTPIPDPWEDLAAHALAA